MSHLEVPAELAFSMAKTDRWTPEVTERSLAKVSPGDVAVKGRRKKRNQQQVCMMTWKKPRLPTYCYKSIFFAAAF